MELSQRQFHFWYNGEYNIEVIYMNDLQEIWNDLDEAYEHMERAIEKMSGMSLSKELYERKEKFDLSEISYMKQLVEEMMENNI
jgi:hypothetical protein|nr:MAG TPA: hypothetical protein [Caudoviricetes sp.]